MNREDYVKSLIDEINSANRRYILAVDNLRFREPNITPKDAKLNGRDYKVKVYGDLSITDTKTDKTKKYNNMHLFDIPKQTDLGTFIIKGTEYNVVKQLRKLPGVYYRFSAGKPLALFNTGAKSNFKILYNPDTLIFSMYYNGNIPLYPLLIYLGYTDDELSKAWGNDILEANKNNSSVQPDEAARRLYKKMFYGKLPKDGLDVKEGILTQFEESTLDKKDNEAFLGVNSGHVTPETIVAATQKLIDLAASKIDEHDGNDIYSSKIADYNDFIKEKISKGTDSRNLRRWLGKVFDGSIGLYGAIQKPINSTFTTFEMSNVFNQTNPVAMLANNMEVSKMGPGAIGQANAVTLADSDLRANYAGFLDPAKTPESHKVGVSLYLTRNVSKGPNGEIKTKLYNLKTNKIESVGNQELIHKIVAFPGQYKFGPNGAKPMKAKIHAYRDGDIIDVPANKVDYVIRNSEDLFNYASLTVPFLNSDQGNRLLMAAKHVVQALPLKYNEAPKVQIDYSGPTGKNVTLEQMLASITANGRELSKWDGKVISVRDYITIEDTDKQKHKVYIYKDYPLNGDVYFNEEPLVKAGDIVKKGQRILKNNYMDGDALALGTNMNVAYLPYKGSNYEDGVVISDKAAQKLTSTHMYIYTEKLTSDITGEKSEASKSKFVAAFPGKYNASQLSKIDNNGIIKKGEHVDPGDPLMLIVRKASPTYEEKLFKVSTKLLRNRYKNMSVEWDKDYPGVVSDVSVHNNLIRVTVKTEEPAQVGDKITGRHGNKGIITKIIPESEMPEDKDGNRPDILLSPLGIVSRINPGQLYETVAGKAASKAGKVVKIKPFAEDRYDEVKNLAKKYGIDTNTMMKYPDQKDYKPVLAGTQYIYKLDQSVSHKLSGVNEGVPYSRLSGQPVKTEEGNPQSMDHLTLYAMLAHGAKHNIHEMGTYKSDINNKEYWRNLELGMPLPKPKTPMSLQKFVDMLKGAGINVENYGNTFELQPLTDDKIKEMAPKALPNPSQLLKAKNLEPIKGGLYDVKLTGGLNGDAWTRIELPTAIPNPVFEEAVKTILRDRYGLKQSDFDKILDGELHIDPKTLKPADKGLTGSEAFKKLLDFNVKDYEKELSNRAKKSRSVNNKNLAYKALKYVKALDRLNYEPYQAYMIKNVPVIPPVLRPIYTDKAGKVMIPDVNHLYKDLATIIESRGDGKDLPDSVRHKLDRDIYKATAAIEGWGDPVTNPNLRGIAKNIIGSSPKTGFFQSKLVDRRQLTSGRSTITPDPKLGINEVGIPQDMAWNIFRPYILKDLISKGYKPIDALDAWKKKTEAAKAALKRSMEKRPVMLNRAPSLHKWSIMAFKPKLVAGKDIRVNQLIVKPFNADFDGDQQINMVVVNALDKDIEKRYTSNSKYNINYWRLRRMSSRQVKGLPYIKGGNYYLINLEDFPYMEDRLIGEKEGIRFYESEKFLKVVAYDEKSGGLVLADVSGWSIHTGHEVWLVNLKDKHQIITDDDERAVYGIDPKSMEFVRRRPKDAMGILVPRARYYTKLGKEYSGAIDHINSKSPLLERIPLNREFGHLLGFFVGNGWVSRAHGELQGQVNFSSIYDEIINQITVELSVLRKDSKAHIGLKFTKDSFGTSATNTYSNMETSRLFSNLIGHTAAHKHLPPFWFIAPLEFKYGLIAGLLDSDGSISVSHAKKKPQLMASYTSINLRLVQEVQALLASVGVASRISWSKKSSAGNDLWILTISAVDLSRIRDKLKLYSSHKSEALYTVGVSEYGSSASMELCPYNATIHNLVKNKLLHTDKTLYTMSAKGKQVGYITKSGARRVYNLLKDSIKFPANWVKIIMDDDIVWSPVISVENTGKVETGYDLTVPGYETFMSVDGIILSNTMSVHVPSSPLAVEEAKTLMPSENIIKYGQNTLFIMPQTEVLLGIYEMSKVNGHTIGNYADLNAALNAYHKGKLSINQRTKIGNVTTSLGNYLLNSVLPDKYKAYNVEFDRNHVRDVLYKIYRNNRGSYINVVNALKDLGNKYGTDIRPSINYKDLKPIDSYKKLIHKSNGAKLIESDLSKRNNTFAMYASKGIRGKQNQVRQILAAPIKAVSIRGKEYAGINHPYAYGLSPTEYYKAAFGARQGAINKNKMTRDPGAFNKELAANYVPLVVTRMSSNDPGIEIDVGNPTLTSRYLARDITYKGKTIAKRGQLITPSIKADIKKRGIKKVWVMSPLTDPTPDGIAAKSFGLMPDGKLPDIGTNIGLLATHSITEPLSQSTLSAFHTGGVKGGETGLEAVWGLFRNVKKPDDAVLTFSDGRITKIEKIDKGGYKIYVDDDPYICPPTNKPIVKEGQHVKRGDALTNGKINQKELMELKDHKAVERYMLEALKNNLGPGYKDDRFLEVLIRGATDKAEVTDPGKNLWTDKGDITSATFLDDINRTRMADIPIAYAEGSTLAKPIEDLFHKGEILKKKDIEKLKAHGIDEVTVKAYPIKYKRIMISTSYAPVKTQNWLESMNFSRLSNILRDTSASGGVANINKPSPIPRYITGKPLFGANED